MRSYLSYSNEKINISSSCTQCERYFGTTVDNKEFNNCHVYPRPRQMSAVRTCFTLLH